MAPKKINTQFEPSEKVHEMVYESVSKASSGLTHQEQFDFCLLMILNCANRIKGLSDEGMTLDIMSTVISLLDIDMEVALKRSFTPEQVDKIEEVIKTSSNNKTHDQFH